MAKKQSNRIMLLGTLAGAAIGAGVALVYAPDKGEDNRKHLLEWTNARLGEVRVKVQDALPGSK